MKTTDWLIIIGGYFLLKSGAVSGLNITGSGTATSNTSGEATSGFSAGLTPSQNAAETAYQYGGSAGRAVGSTADLKSMADQILGFLKQQQATTTTTKTGDIVNTLPLSAPKSTPISAAATVQATPGVINNQVAAALTQQAGSAQNLKGQNLATFTTTYGTQVVSSGILAGASVGSPAYQVAMGTYKG